MTDRTVTRPVPLRLRLPLWLMSIAALREVLDAFDAEGLPSAAAMDEAVTLDIEELVGLQQWDGGWAWWGRNLPSQPYQTVQVTHALLLARENGYRVPQATLDMALQYLADIRSHIPAEYGEDERTAIRAYALWVLALADMRDFGAAEALAHAQDGHAAAGRELEVEDAARFHRHRRDRDRLRRKLADAGEQARAARDAIEGGARVGVLLTVERGGLGRGAVLEPAVGIDDLDAVVGLAHGTHGGRRGHAGRGRGGRSCIGRRGLRGRRGGRGGGRLGGFTRFLGDGRKSEAGHRQAQGERACGWGHGVVLSAGAANWRAARRA